MSESKIQLSPKDARALARLGIEVRRRNDRAMRRDQAIEAGRRDGARLVEEDFRERGSEAIRASLALAHINNAWEEDAAYGDAAGRRLYPVPARWHRAYYAALAERAEERARELLEHGMEPAL